jgi:hypothetical protein
MRTCRWKAASSDLIYLGIGAAVGLGISVGVAWSHRAELKQGGRELLGLPHRFSVGERIGSERIDDRV